MAVSKCPTGEYFNPRLDKCMKVVQPVDIPDYCKVHPTAMIPDPTNCAKFYNCSQNMATKTAVASECKYPDLFSDVSQKCERFQNVSCKSRMEPQAPCEYDQNLCKPGDMNCELCPKRLPSCRGLPDGDEAVQSALWTDLYVTCLINRTMAVRHCPVGQVFDPSQLHCVSKIPKGNIDAFCLANPTSIVPHPDTCGQYYNCSAMSKYGHHLQECQYPDLFDDVSLTCKDFEQVKCNKSKHEPEAPCEYLQNRCNASDTSCLPCPKRLPSCVGHPDGDNSFPNKLWMSDYITCYKNRTLNVTQCSHGYFNPRTVKCEDAVPKVDVPDYCTAHPSAVLPDPDNCAHYFNCSDPTMATINRGAGQTPGNYRKECHYPDLFDDSIKQCNNFEMVNCSKKPEPQAPCDYQQNLCQAINKTCEPCTKRLPSCVGKSDGLNPFLAKMWQADYVRCYINRTMAVTKCLTGEYFNPRLDKCMKVVQPVDVPDYCTAHPSSILPDPDNCAHYFNCSDPTIATITRGAGQTQGNYRKECHYPDLFDDSIKQCNNFEMVNCSKKPEPQAPCDYQQNLCQAVNKTCDPCTKRLPSCVGKSDGLNPFPAKMWQADYVRCYKNRTMAVPKCPTGEYFNPRLNKCMKVVQPVDIPDYCKVHPIAMIPDPTNCAKFYNCSQNMATQTAVTSECKYPDLFSDVSQSCEKFQNVSCITRKEPQAPCEYDQNLCKPGDMNCEVCPKRLPSCRGLPDGDEAVQSALWTDLYVTCLINRTMAVRHCPVGQVFDPTQLHCISKIPKGNIDAFCLANPTSIVPHPDTCGQYYNCSAMSKYGHHLQECQYPDLFDDVSLTCKDFEQVKCNKSKHEPEAPCEYLQNRCNITNPNCPPCPKRLPSCVGHPDGANPFPNKLWKADYITCYKNRTLNVTHCSHGYFNLRTGKCEDDVPKVDVPKYCQANPTEILPDPDNCAHYYNCSIAMATTFRSGTPVVVSQKQMECPYPDLYDPVRRMCANFSSIDCKQRKEPQAPCEYEQNLCKPGDVSCPPCPDRLPSCVGMPDGPNMFTGREWKADYAICYQNRTLELKKCSTGYFHPITHVCTEIVNHVDVPAYCKANPREIIPDHDNCAHYFDCTKVNQNRTTRAMTTGGMSECKYPDLFDAQTLTCQSFTTVTCHDRPEPQAPCDYIQNLCNPGDSKCDKCPNRLPSCVGQLDGFQPFPNHLWEDKFIQCYKNRTMKVDHCPLNQFFNPRTLKCADKVQPVDVKDYCTVHPTSMIPDYQNCAKLYNCTDGTHTECTYPDLYNVQTQMCQNFMTTRCDGRQEPQAPCEYDQNLCPPGDQSCKPCPERLPSCRGLPDGDRPVSTALWTNVYVTCLHNRTMAVRDCPPGSVFNPVTLQCMSVVAKSNVDNVCGANPTMIKPNTNNCGQYYNCSAVTKYGHHLMECTYPDLFDPITGQCKEFYNVQCDQKHEPMAPCEYLQNLCQQSNTSCAPCSTRLPSCVGLPDGTNPFPGRMWKADFIRCDRNRTVEITHCKSGYFHPRKMICTKEVIPVDIPDYCGANPSDVLPDPDNCGRYYNCSMSPGHGTKRSMSPLKISAYHIECRYPDLFDLTTMQCAGFETVNCPNRKEPQAPCEYQQHICTPGDLSCTRCPDRLPSCVRLSDGPHPVPTQLWMTGFIVCYKNRTVNVTDCANNEYFNPRLNSCMKKVIPVDVPEYCKAHRTAVLPDPGDCAKYYNCSSTKHEECKYPDLYNPSTLSCDKFTSVSCDQRQEPQAPCQYDQNKCPVSDPNCKPCPERLPSCIGLPDGLNIFPGKLWKTDYIQCYKNRTIDVKVCTTGYFHPVQKMCMIEVKPVDVKNYCKANPLDILPDPDNCSHYYNCTQVNLSTVTTSTECAYPDLFSPVTQRCEMFTSVKCMKRPEPQAPCEYEKNLCTGTSCQPCPDRLPSCVGLSDGNHAYPAQMWKSGYVTCYKNRTTNIRKCTTGYFHPGRHVCMVDVVSVDVPEYCKANTAVIIPDPTNCAKYYNCSDPTRQYMKECTYPDLFSTITQRCERFQMVGCRKRPEPQAPCEYNHNLCIVNDPNCQPCPSRLPSCVGIPDGDRPFPAHQWTDLYITCLTNRTIAIRHCPSGSVFDPSRLQCVNRIEQGNLQSYCAANPTTKKRHPTNCAKYIDCSTKSSPYGDYIKECTYPDLFSRVTFKCENFSTVNCIPLQEPLAPCEYEQNLCKPNDANCKPCSSRLPSCVGLPDGVNYFPGKLWTDSYIRCFRNRTISVEKCPDGYFHPRQHLCVKTVDRVDIPDYCQSHLDAVLPDPANCGHYFNCSFLATHRSMEISECKYPDLFSVTSRRCEPFYNVQCQNRYQPQAPCEYVQNLCLTSNVNCIPCPGRLPSCRGLPDGLHSFPGRQWMEDYIRCDRNRTVEVSKCQTGYFNPTSRQCTTQHGPNTVPEYCKAHPTAVIPKGDNCVQYYNCSVGLTRYGRNVMECTYPDMFSTVTSQCERFTSVSCKDRPEHQAPCDYTQNRCYNDPTCQPCSSRLPSCIGKQDGQQAFTGKLWTDLYIQCQQNRTVAVVHCPKYQVFDPHHRQCISARNIKNIDEFCRANPTVIQEYSDSCAMYINCSRTGHYLVECKYPDLYSTVSKTCQSFKSVTCGKRPEPQKPCDYKQNLCMPGDISCQPCTERLPSCVGLGDGSNPHPYHMWGIEYIVCDKNRTIHVDKCSQGYFNPRTLTCTVTVLKVDVIDYCKVHSNDVLPDPDNCAKYYRCRDQMSKFIGQTGDCTYPDLFSTSTKACESFTTVNCGTRKEPQAPCEYQKNICSRTDLTCVPCPDRLPSCVGKPDGSNSFPGKLWSHDYITCLRNRTVTVTQCPQGQFFNPDSKQCTNQISTTDIDSFCTANPTSLKPHPSNCAQYYNCSDVNSRYGRYLEECTYPDLFSPVTMRCQNYQTVSCDAKHEPKAPCEYRAHVCDGTSAVCTPCPERLPSCIGQTDGHHMFPGRSWLKDYIVCVNERTIVQKCDSGYFNPHLHQCTDNVGVTDIPSYCRSYPGTILPHPTDCAKYFRCPTNKFDTITYQEECTYPDLYSTVSHSCQNFTSVSCGIRQEPQAPCEYSQNQCQPGSMNCLPCSQRLFSCRGLPDGNNAVPGHRWSDQYDTCYRNRTVKVNKCASGMFDPLTRACDNQIDKDNIDEYCRTHPTSVLPHPNNCAQYFNCRDRNSKFGHYLEECTYPQLFSSLIKTCTNFTTARCEKRFVPQAPCEYMQNQNIGSIKQTVSCPERLPSCIGLPDGRNMFPARKWKSDYIMCYRNRTLSVYHCDTGYFFDPYTRFCVKYIDTVHMKEFCQANPSSVMPSMTNCAQYYTCQDYMKGSMLRECSYPDLFSLSTMSCQRFSLVNCQQRPQPQAPCEYMGNQCRSGDTNCKPCSQRLPSCVSRPDGNVPVIGQYWSPDYLICLRNRTISVTKCQTGLFDPINRRCTLLIDFSNIVSICKANPTLKFENQQNCAQYYDCSKPSTGYLVECKYPDLYSTVYQGCKTYRDVTCGKRPEPQAPCEYSQNLCRQGATTCKPCPERHPSCVGLPDGRNAILPWTDHYVVCLKNRTVSTGICTSGIFNPVERLCIVNLHPGDLLKYCQSNPHGIIASSLNAAQYFDCSQYNSPNGHYLMECPYPQLFSTVSYRCEEFVTVTPDKRPIPQAPCEYLQYHCKSGDLTCTPCENVHHSCIGVPNGDQAITYRKWQAQYVRCYQNRTLEEKVCQQGLFDPVKKTCSDTVNTDQIDVYCQQHPHAIVKHPGDCAMYYNCSNPNSKYGRYIEECHYPELFSSLTLRCEGFENVVCKPRHEPQAPCEYQQNLCKSTDASCTPCSQRIPSCVGLPDGFNPIPGRLWSKDYVQCDRNRTIHVLHCKQGYFSPGEKACVTAIKSGDGNQFCNTNPRILIRSSDHCGQYIDCRYTRRIGGYVKECPYPDLFNPDTLECGEFTKVTCGKVPEPQAPCSYEKNLCLDPYEKCTPCPERLPSCVGLPDGDNVFAGKIWSQHYVVCYKNRTKTIKQCSSGFFDPQNRKCSSQVGTDNIATFCSHHPAARIPNKVNCAQYYDCSNRNSIYQPYLHECTYPKLFSVATLRCEDFEQVTCGARTEPKAPCQYLQNQCPSTDQSCLPCPMRLPSCLGLPDGDNAYPGHRHWTKYINCYKERTKEIKECSMGYFDEHTKRCLVEQHTTPVPTCGVDQFECDNGQCIQVTDRCNNQFDCSDRSDEINCVVKTVCPEGEWRCDNGQCLSPLSRCDGRIQCSDKSDEAGCHYNTTPRPGTYMNICHNQQNGRAPHPTNCAKYYDCSDKYHPVLQECPYPFLYSTLHRSCQNFEYVQCGQRYEPQAPCEFDQNKCKALDNKCEPCIERLPSCVGLSDGRHAFAGQLWTPKFILCHRNRTIEVTDCPDNKKFDPDQRFCVNPTIVGNVFDYCKHNPTAVLPHPDNCGQYYNCSNIYTLLGSYIEECSYPKLFDLSTGQCKYYTEVNCGQKSEPKGPCEYELNKCHTSDCTPCEERFVSCVGKPDGANSLPGVELSAHYVMCKDGRTITQEVCQSNYIFSPVSRSCIQVDKESLDDVCDKYPGIARPHPYNCAQFIDCTTKRPGFAVTKYIKECPYPQMFSTDTLECHDFEHVTCDKRHQPYAPCEYLQNLCSGTDPSCIECVERLPSCRELPDGNNPIATKLWSQSYLVCHKNRTMSVDKCTTGVFDPYKKHCVDEKKPSVCSMSSGLVAKGDNCAQYYDCSSPVTEFGQYLQECPYPQLFNDDTQQCQHFSQVECKSRYQPKAPCEYLQTQCIGVGCGRCEKSHPSCVGLFDGANSYPDRPMTPDYIICDHGRTISTEHCNTGLFDPSTKTCRACSPDMINSYCRSNANLVLPSPDNCAQFYQCGEINHMTGSYLRECAYPKLYDASSQTCKHFTQVSCGPRHEPKAPCEYLQNQCHQDDGENCLPCQLRLPSCIGLSDGRHWHPDPGRITQYITCEGERTVAIDDCSEGMYFEQIVKDCLPLKYYSLLLAFNKGQDVCKNSLVSGVAEDKLTSSSQFGSGDPFSDYGAARGKLNNKEVMDNTGKTLIGAWVAGKNDVDQYIQVELPSPSLVRGITTQGRDGCCKQWTTKYRVMYSLDCKTDWKPVGQLGTSDTFFKGNDDENTPQSNMFDCPVIAKCIRVNPLEWSNRIALRFDLIGCALDSGNKTGSKNNNALSTSAPTAVPMTTPSPTTAVPMTTSSPTQRATAAVTTQGPIAVVTTGQNSLSGKGKFDCITSCKGKSSGYYGACDDCFGYITCNWGITYKRKCPSGLKWNSDLKVCDYKSNCSIP
ncbi:uncharacterized protein [Mytilus edulis]|uniref:uncharacterized protein isoform X2 n=1 Tax=Mytilus edulis TaxID=6550 RepID=UPI0039EEF6CB